jgi:hypothetical protein
MNHSVHVTNGANEDQTRVEQLVCIVCVFVSDLSIASTGAYWHTRDQLYVLIYMRTL